MSVEYTTESEKQQIAEGCPRLKLSIFTLFSFKCIKGNVVARCNLKFITSKSFETTSN